eukprot:1859745-Prorocentrum_lima.AAC.1
MPRTLPLTLRWPPPRRILVLSTGVKKLIRWFSGGQSLDPPCVWCKSISRQLDTLAAVAVA